MREVRLSSFFWVRSQMTIAVRPRSLVFLALACLLIVLLAGRARAAPGHLDTKFGGDGRVNFALPDLRGRT